MTKKDMIKGIVVMLVICIVGAGLLAVVNHFTAPVIEAGAIERENETRKASLPAAASFEEIPLELLPASITGAAKGFAADGSVAGYVFTAASRGFDGDVLVMTALDADGVILKTTAVDVTSETPTLGGQVTQSSYANQYAGKESTDGVNAISGATITSNAYKACVQESLTAFAAVKEG